MPLTPQQKQYRKTRYETRRLAIIDFLGARCNSCGCTEIDNLEIDHIDPNTKSFEVLTCCWWMKWDTLLVEVKKCQLLCSACHTSKSINDLGNTPAKGTHGTISAYRYCHCDLCKAAKNLNTKEYKKRTGRTKGSRPRTGLVHGTGNAYGYYKCRCDICVEGKKQRDALYRKTRDLITKTENKESPAL